MVGSAAWDVRMSQGGSGVSLLKKIIINQVAQCGGKVAWKWTSIIESMNVFVFTLGWPYCLPGDYLVCLLQSVWNAPYFSLKPRDRQRNDIFLAKINLKFSAGAHMNHLLSGSFFRLLRKTIVNCRRPRGQECHWVPSYRMWIGPHYLTKEVYCPISLYSSPRALNSLWLPWPQKHANLVSKLIDIMPMSRTYFPTWAN